MKIIGTLLGVFCLSAVLFLFWWLRWQDESQVFVDEAVKQIAILEQHWNENSALREGRFEIDYEEAHASGFPFSMKVRLLKPALRDESAGKRFSVGMPYIDLVPVGQSTRTFRVEYPDYADALFEYSNQQTHFYLHLSKKPELTLRKHTLRSAAVNEFALTYPKSLTLSIDSKGKHFQWPMQFKVAGQPIWSPLYSDMRLQMRHFQDFLRRSMLGL